MLLVGLHGLVGSGTTDELVAELGLVLLSDLTLGVELAELLSGLSLLAVAACTDSVSYGHIDVLCDVRVYSLNQPMIVKV